MNAVSGLSPLARGTPNVSEQIQLDIRFIPAGAGNTEPVVTPKICGAVYPRWRGEHDLISFSDSSPNGLSPLARGTPITGCLFVVQFRFIPAGAGNTTAQEFYDAIASVYPRWRGEHTPAIGGLVTLFGLSPLARGTLKFAVVATDNNRFIPAGAGNTTMSDCVDPIDTVYPRWRGEHIII